MLIKELNPKHIEALVALNRLFTIAEVWNKADGFVPDSSGFEQKKWYPWFKYDKDTAEFVCADTYNAPTAALSAPPTPRQAAKLLHYAQKWRRGKKCAMLPPAILGVAIDMAIRTMRKC